jgi:hypothetical protein
MSPQGSSQFTGARLRPGAMPITEILSRRTERSGRAIAGTRAAFPQTRNRASLV